MIVYKSDLGGSLTEELLDTYAKRLGGYLQQAGIQKGDRVAVCMPNILQYPVAIHAILGIGAVLVNLNPLYTATEIQEILDDSGAKALIAFDGANLENVSCDLIVTTGVGDLTDRSMLVNLACYFKGHRRQSKTRLTSILAYPHHKDVVHVDRDDLAVLQYTGGTTGKPKGVMLTHHNIISNGNQIMDRMGDHLTSGDVVVNPLPLYHVYSFIVSIMYLPRMGVQTLLVANPKDIKGFVKTLLKNKFSGFIGLNTLFNALMKNEDFSKVDFQFLNTTLSGGMPLSEDVANRWFDLTGCQIFEGYGLTETSPVLCLDDPKNITQGTVGMPVEGVKFKIDKKTKELLVKGPNVMKGYWNKPEETKKVFTWNGWFRTGDVAEVVDGKLRITDRIKNMAIISGFNVYPTEVENAIVSHNFVDEAGVIGVNPGANEKLVAFVVLKHDMQDSSLIAYLREKLAAYKVPKEIIFVDSLPKSPVGKVLHKDLRDLYDSEYSK